MPDATLRQHLTAIIAMHPPRISPRGQAVRDHALGALACLDNSHHALNDPRVGGYVTDEYGARYRLVADPVRPDTEFGVPWVVVASEHTDA